MSQLKKKRVCLSIDVKRKLLKEIDEKVLSKTEIARKYGIPANTLSTILKAREKVESAHQAGVGPTRKYSRDAKYPEMEKALLAWLRKMRGNNVPIDGNLLKEQADVFALRLNLADFKASGLWLQKFKLRHGLSFRKVCGESGAVNMETVNEWKEMHLKELLDEYSPDDVFNADETGLFYKLLPDRTLVFKGESCSAGKHAKQRITVMMAANMSGSEKLPLLIIGKSKNQRCFKNLKRLPAEWHANKKAWMTADIYRKWLLDLDRRFKQKKRKILLVVDNCTAHIPVDGLGLEAIRVKFLPPNVTSVLQPMDQGVIQCFKTKYRRKLVKRVVLNLQHGQLYEIDVLGAMHLAVLAWNEVDQTTIANSFRHAGFVKAGNTGPVSIAEVNREEAAEDELLLDALKSKNLNVPSTFADFSNVDSEVICIQDISDDDIIKEILEPEGEEADVSDEEESEVLAKPSSKEAAAALFVLRRFFEAEENSELQLESVNALENSVLKSVVRKQSKITVFFSREVK